MAEFVEGVDRRQTTLLPECLEDWVDENNPVRAVDVFVDALDLAALGFAGVQPQATGRPGYHPAVLLKLTFMAISPACSRAAVLSARRVAISK